MWSFELNTDRYFNTTTKKDISLLCNMSETTIKDAVCTTSFKSATSCCSFTLRYNDYTELYDTTVKYILQNTSSQTPIYFRIQEATSTGTVTHFQGKLSSETIELASAKIAQGLSLEAKDFTTELDRKIGHNEYIESTTLEPVLVTTIVRKLLKYAGQGYFHTSDVTVVSGKTYYTLNDDGFFHEVSSPSSSSISTYYEWADPIYATALANTHTKDYFVLDESTDSSTTYRQKIDQLLFEVPGYVLHYRHSDGKYEILQSVSQRPTGDTTELRTVTFGIKDQLKTSSEIYDKDGVLVKWYTVGTKTNQTVFSADLGTKYDEDEGKIVGTTIAKKTYYTNYYPETGDAEEVTESFSMPDREYELSLTKVKNKDISLLYVKPETCSLIVRSEGGTLKHDAYEDSTTGVSYNPNPSIYPTHCKFLFWNDSTLEDTNLTQISIEGTAVYKQRENECTVPATVKDPDEYTSTIYNATQAENFTKWYYNAQKVSQTKATWTEYADAEDFSTLGERVYVQHKGVSLKQEFIVIQIDNAPMIGTKRQYKVTAVAVGGWEAGASVKRVSNMTSGTTVQKDVVKSYIKYTITDTDAEPGSSAVWSDTYTYTEGSWLWTRTTVEFLDSTSTSYLSSKTYMPFRDAEYSLTVDPMTVIRNDTSTAYQRLTFTANIAGYKTDQYRVEYRVGAEYLCDLYSKSTDTSAQTGTSYYTFSLTQDTAPTSDKQYYTYDSTTDVYTEAVRIAWDGTKSFVEGVSYYERESATFVQGSVYVQSYDAHTNPLQYDLVENNGYVNVLTIALYNAKEETIKDSQDLTVLNQTTSARCLGVLTAESTSFPQKRAEDELLLVGDYVVFKEANTTITTGYTYPAGSIWKYQNDEDEPWVQIGQGNGDSEEKLGALQALMDADADLNALNESSAISWFSDVVAKTITGDTIGANQILLNDNGHLRGGDYTASGTLPTGGTGVFINDKGILKATNATLDLAQLNNVTIDKTSKIYGKLICGEADTPILETEFNSSGNYTYTAQTPSVPNGFRWSEILSLLNGWYSNSASQSQFQIKGDGTLNNATISGDLSVWSVGASGSINSQTTNAYVYCSNSSTLKISKTRSTNKRSATSVCTLSFTNPLPFPVTVTYSASRGFGEWGAIVRWGISLTGVAYTISGTQSESKTLWSAQYKDYANAQYDDWSATNLTLNAGATITWTFGQLEAPSYSWNEGVRNTTVNMSITIPADKMQVGHNFYYNGNRICWVDFLNGTYFTFPASTTSTTGIQNLTINEISRINLPISSASWTSGVNKYYKFAHTLNSGTPSSVTFSIFNTLSSLYVIDADGGTLGTRSTPVASLLSVLELSSNSVKFLYNGTYYSTTTNTWVRSFDIRATMSTKTPGLYVADIFPRLNGDDVYSTPQNNIGSASNRFKLLAVKDVNASGTVSCDTISSTGNMTCGNDISSHSLHATNVYTTGNVDADGNVYGSNVNCSNVNASSSITCNGYSVLNTNSIKLITKTSATISSYIGYVYADTLSIIGDIHRYYIQVSGSMYYLYFTLPTGGKYTYWVQSYTGYTSAPVENVAGGSNILLDSDDDTGRIQYFGIVYVRRT